MATVVIGSYQSLLEDIRKDHINTIKNVKRFVNSAKYRIPALCEALQTQEQPDGTKLSLESIREIIYNDCSEFWERETIRKSFPDSMKEDYTDRHQEELIPQGFSLYGQSGMIIPIEDKKYFSQEIESTILLLKRTFRQLVKEAQEGNDIQKAFSDYCFAAKSIKNIKDYIENTGKQYKLQLVDPTDDQVKQLRKPISVYNLDFPMHEDLEPYIESIREKAELFQKQIDSMIDALYRYPIFSIEDAQYMDKCMSSLLIQGYQAINLKSSQTLDEMFKTEELTQSLTEKQAGKDSKTVTLACRKCLKKYDPERNDDPPIMEIDRSSPTGFRCPDCLCVDMVERGLTKDIVIQRRPFLDKVKVHVENYPPLGIFERFGKSVKEVLTGTRKALANPLLKQTSFGSTNDGFRKL